MSSTIEERHLAHSNALHSFERGLGPYHVGPLARFNLNFDRLCALAREVAATIGLAPPVRNPFRSIVVRSIETIHAIDEAIRIIENYREPDKPAVDIAVKPGTGFGVSEAPRGLLYHRYKINAEDPADWPNRPSLGIAVSDWPRIRCSTVRSEYISSLMIFHQQQQPW